MTIHHLILAVWTTDDETNAIIADLMHTYKIKSLTIYKVNLQA